MVVSAVSGDGFGSISQGHRCRYGTRCTRSEIEVCSLRWSPIWRHQGAAHSFSPSTILES